MLKVQTLPSFLPCKLLFQQAPASLAELLREFQSKRAGAIWPRPVARRPSASRMCSPSRTGRPSAPMVVETTGNPAAHASRIFSRVPLPARRGTTATRARADLRDGVRPRAPKLRCGDRRRSTRGRRPGSFPPGATPAAASVPAVRARPAGGRTAPPSGWDGTPCCRKRRSPRRRGAAAGGRREAHWDKRATAGSRRDAAGRIRHRAPEGTRTVKTGAAIAVPCLAKPAAKRACSQPADLPSVAAQRAVQHGFDIVQVENGAVAGGREELAVRGAPGMLDDPDLVAAALED